MEMCPAVVSGVPTLYMDNVLKVMEDGSSTWPTRIVDAYGGRAEAGSPIEMTMSYDEDAVTVDVAVDVLDPMTAESYHLVVAVTEDDIYAPGSNGEEYHNQVFRRLFPGQNGIPVSTEPGEQIYTIDLDLDPEWAADNLRATAWVQADTTGAILNSATMMLTTGTTDVAGDDRVVEAVAELDGA